MPPELNGAANAAQSTGLIGHPFFNQTSFEGAGISIGFCVWGGGACNNGVGAMQNAS